MGKPAARNTDTAMTCNDPVDSPVGKIIAVGTVFINNLPAAKEMDQVVGIDTHIIMIPAPPGPPVPTPLPHPFAGQLNGALSTTVKIMGKAAAVQGSTADNMPAHIPQGGPFQKPPTNKATIQMGSPTVMIGDGGGGGSGQTGSAAAVQAQAAAAAGEGHYLDVKFVDKGGKPITGPAYTVKDPEGKETTGTLAERIKMTGVTEGDFEISLRAIVKAAWGAGKARNGEKVKIQVETAGMADGTAATIEIWQKDLNRPDSKIATIAGKEISGDKLEIDWEYEYPDDVDSPPLTRQERRYCHPKYYFIARVGDCQARSSILDYKDYIEINARDNEGNPLANEEYVAVLPTGEVKRGKLDGNGHVKIENVPPGPWDLRFPKRDITQERD